VNPTLDVIEKRRSVRAYSPQPLSLEEREAILHAAFRAPTAGAMMLYSIIEVDDQALKDRLADTCDHQPFIAKSPYVLLFLADYQRWMDIYTYSGVEARCRELGIPFRTPQAGDMMLACCDALIAAQTAVIAAESMGIGSCYVGDILEQYEVHKQLFNLPRYVLPLTLVCFGRPASPDAPRRLAPRFDRRFIVHTDRYQPISQAGVDEMFQLHAEQSGMSWKLSPNAQNFGQENYLHKFNAKFSLEMNRSVNEMLKNWD
jgi:FMN reductase (NADPH)/FMN reductase [NAD(P)H]